MSSVSHALANFPPPHSTSAAISRSQARAGSASPTEYYYFGAQRVAMRQGSSVTYLHSDHLGSSNVASNGSGALISRQTYFPFGTPRASDTAQMTAVTDFGFTGQKLDASDGLMYYNARYYDAVLGRFISADTIVPSAGNPQSLNRYSYVLNNPVKYIDPTGHAETCDQGEGCGTPGEWAPDPVESYETGNNPSQNQFPDWWDDAAEGFLQFFGAKASAKPLALGPFGPSNSPYFYPAANSVTYQIQAQVAIGGQNTIVTLSPTGPISLNGGSIDLSQNGISANTPIVQSTTIGNESSINANAHIGMPNATSFPYQGEINAKSKTNITDHLTVSVEGSLVIEVNNNPVGTTLVAATGAGWMYKEAIGAAISQVLQKGFGQGPVTAPLH